MTSAQPRISSATDHTYQRELLLLTGALGLLGSIVPNFANLIASALTDHDFIADTISDLGRGRYKWIMDTGFYINAAGLISLSIGSAHAHLGGRLWSLGVISLALLSLVTIMIGLWDQFGGEDMSIHTRLTFVLGPLYLIGPLVMAKGIAVVAPKLRVVFLVAAVAWIVLATGFKLAPDAYDGIIEKLAVLSTLVWTVPLSWMLILIARKT